MRWLLSALLLLSSQASAAPPKAQPPDFYLMMDKCSATVGYLVLSDESLKTLEGAPVTNACWRRGKAVSCRLSFDDGTAGVKGNAAQYAVILDSPPLLWFSDDVTGEMFAIDTVAHAAVLVTRVVDKAFLGAKVCHGFFATQSEMEEVQKKQ